jgi:CHAD domain-containing protein
MKVQRMRSQKSQKIQQPAVWCNKHEAAQILGLSESTLKKLRLSEQLVEGIHWVRFSSRCVRYNVELLKDWAATRAESANHDQAVANFLSSLPSNQPQTRGRRIHKKPA